MSAARSPLLVALLAAACGSSSTASSTDGGGDGGDGDRVDGAAEALDSGGSGDCIADGDPFDPAGLEARVSFLASDELAGRGPDTPGDREARATIEERFRCLGLTPAGPDGSFQQPFVAPDDLATANVVAYAPGSDPDLASEIIVVGAHHDHLGVRGGEIHNGANDNASGVAAMLAVAQAIQQRDTPPRRTIAFAAFGYEENDGPCLGSEFYAANPPEALPIDQVVYMVDADMVGTYPSEERVVAYGSLPGTPGRDLLDALLPTRPELTVALGDRAARDDSDFQAFCNLGIPYVYFETWDEACYHRPCDDADHLDYSSMSSITALLAEVVVGLADGDTDLAGARGLRPCLLP